MLLIADFSCITATCGSGLRVVHVWIVISKPQHWRQVHSTFQLPAAAYLQVPEPKVLFGQLISSEVNFLILLTFNLVLGGRTCKWGRYAGALEYIVCYRTYTQSTPLPPLFSVHSYYYYDYLYLWYFSLLLACLYREHTQCMAQFT